ncbi:acetylornithine transaminase [Aeromicrobium senzhongii]|uniref:Acetylornithine aminotransferase n=1 Tax=Aeromicrobium senzhongii TaxID=2663859 RepID=A0ABX6SY74_9ACTN|nr:acetylornithine transaminase [Aeromicrobium senzhongii]MTB89311.1 acetylornithine transaminase [Aeromicrobium senzhongii]QNL95966.1 acetylornithine transaminase [Aeromicrobium senzhongii]
MERYRSSLMNTFGDPLRVLVRGEGSHVWDADGNRYLDLLGGIAVNALGHGHPAILEAVTSQLQTLGHISNFFASAPQIELAEKLLELLDAGEAGGRVFFTNSGTEANEAAFKATRRTGRTTIVAAEGSFHGRTMGALALTSKAAYREPFEPLPGDVRWVPYGDAEALAAAVDETVAAVLLEPIQGEAGVIVPPDDYLAAARRITTEHGALLWLDEVQTGIGRTGDWFGHSPSGVRPDLVTLAKGLGGGLPIGALVALGDAGSLLGPGNHGTTFGGNPVATAAALAVLSTIESEDLLSATRSRGDQLTDGLGRHARVAAVTGRGLLRGVVLTEPRAADVQRAALDAGLIVNAPTPDRLRLAPPLILTEDEAADAVRTLSAVIDEVLA